VLIGVGNLELDKLIRSILSRRDPEGFYVILAKGKGFDIVKRFNDVVVDHVGEDIIIRTKSRKTAVELIRSLHRLGLLLQ